MKARRSVNAAGARSDRAVGVARNRHAALVAAAATADDGIGVGRRGARLERLEDGAAAGRAQAALGVDRDQLDRKSTRLNFSHT